jgi:hypothetical protein
MSLQLDHKLPRHPKVIGLSAHAFRLWMFALCYCDEYATGGRMELAQWRILQGYKSKYVIELQDAGLVEADHSIHDWEDWNQDSETLKARRKHDRERKQRSRDRSRIQSRDVRGSTPTPTPTDRPTPKSPSGDHSGVGLPAWNGSAASRCEDLMEEIGLNSATKARLRRSGLPPERVYAALRDTVDARPSRPGGYVWRLVSKELAGA